MTTAHGQLRSFVDRVCRINTDIKSLNSDKSEIYKEAKGNGFNPKVLKAAIKRYAQLQDDRLGVEEFDAILDLYMQALLGVSDDQEGDETPPAASASPAKGILKSPTRTHAHEADLPPHDEDGVIIEDVPANGPATGAGQRERGSEDADPSEEGADAIALDAPSSPNSEICSPGWSADPQINRACSVEAGLGAARAPDGIISGDETTERFPGTTAGGPDVCQLDRPLLVTAGRDRQPFPSDPDFRQASDGRLTEKETGDAVGSGVASAGFLIAGKSPDPSHQFPCEANGWAGLEPLPQFDRRRPAA